MRIKSGAVVCAVAASVLGLAAMPARADLKLEQTVETRGANPLLMIAGGEAPQTDKVRAKIVTYYKGEKRRVERGDSARIFDDANKTITVIDPKAKTYFVIDTKKPIPEASRGQVPTFTGTADVSAVSETKKVNGKDARRYLYTVILKMSLPGSKSPIATFTLKGDQWASETVGAGTPSPKPSIISLFNALPEEMTAGMKPVMEKLATVKGFIMEENQTITLASVLQTETPKEPFQSVTKTNAISEAPLPDSLFAPPSDYKKVDPPRQ
jgi:hypothetical protein